MGVRTIAALCLVMVVAVALAQEKPTNDRTPAKRKLAVVEHSEHIEALAREPMITAAPDGTLYASGYNRKTPQLWKSIDQGKTWSGVNVGTAEQGAIGNSDMDLAVAPDGTLYYVTMGFDPAAAEGTHVAIGVSRDAGTTWKWTMLSKKRLDDRPWVTIAPNSDAHVIWNDGEGVAHRMSTDRGDTWSAVEKINPAGGSSHVAVGPNGELAVRIIPMSASGNKFTAGVDLIAVSTDSGKTWKKYPAPGKRDWAPMDDPELTQRWVEPLAWDAQGALYSLWTGKKGVWVARSAEKGATWKTWKIVVANDDPHYPYLAARGDGELAATWFAGNGDSLSWRAAIIRVAADGSRPKTVISEPMKTEGWKKDEKNGNLNADEGGEYFPVIFMNNGSIAVVSTIEHESAKRMGFAFWRLALN